MDNPIEELKDELPEKYYAYIPTDFPESVSEPLEKFGHGLTTAVIEYSVQEEGRDREQVARQVQRAIMEGAKDGDLSAHIQEKTGISFQSTQN